MEEERSFVPQRAVGELTPIDVRNGTTRDALYALQLGVVQTHGCLETHIEEFTKHAAAQDLANITANEKRELMAHDIAELKGEMRGMALALGVRKPEEGETKPKARGIAGWPTWAVLTFFGGIGITVPALAQLAQKVAPIVWQWLLGLNS